MDRLLDPAPGFQVQSTISGPQAVITLAGEFDLSVKLAVDAEIDRALSAEPSALVIDLRGLTFIDSSGVHTLVVAHRGCLRRGCPLYLVRGAPLVQRVLELCGLAERLIVIDDPGQAPGTSAESASGQAA